MEEWKPIPGYENIYSASDLGRIKSERRTLIRSNGRPFTVPERILKANPDSQGYLQVTLYALGQNKQGVKYKLVNRLIASAFIRPLSQGECQVDHIDGNPLNNRVDNLQIMEGSHHHWHRSTAPRLRKEVISQALKTWKQAGLLDDETIYHIQDFEERNTTT